MTTRVIISGRVQGVGYRAWTVATASKLGLQGWVRNLSDGSVEAVFHGERVEEILEACKEGPPAARVNDIRVFTHAEIPSGPFVAKPTY